MRDKFQQILTHLGHGLVERESVLKAMLLSILAGENVLLIGPPGTGKSMLARRIAHAFGEETLYFEYLLTKFTTPEELFGPLSISELKADRFKRNTAGYLPTVELAFLDEVFKASSSILNSLLSIMNERVFHNGSEVEKVKLRALIGASNELPTNQEDLSALYDRFLVRCHVDYVSADNLSDLIATNNQSDWKLNCDPFTQTELGQLREAAKAVTIPPDVAEALMSVWQAHREEFKEDRREQLSDRRLMQCLKLIRFSAASNGRENADLSDVFILKDCLWSHPENYSAALKIISKDTKKPICKINKKLRLINLTQCEPNIEEKIENELRKKSTTSHFRFISTIKVNKILFNNLKLKKGNPLIELEITGKPIISFASQSINQTMIIHAPDDLQISHFHVDIGDEITLQQPIAEIATEEINSIPSIEHLQSNIWI